MRNLTKSKKRIVVVFGIFDGIHDGHRNFFAQAKEHGDELVAIVGRDLASLRLKKKQPKHSEGERLNFVLQDQNVDLAVLGDEEQSSYNVLEGLSPNVICFGYDQTDLVKDVRIWMQKTGKNISLRQLDAYRPEKYHTSIL